VRFATNTISHWRTYIYSGNRGCPALVHIRRAQCVMAVWSCSCCNEGLCSPSSLVLHGKDGKDGGNKSSPES